MYGTELADVRWVSETGSTNADLLALAAEGALEGVVLVADNQTEGRGRLDRSWVAPPESSLLVSVLLRPDLDPAQSWLIAAAAGCAVVQACNDALRLPTDAVAKIGLKWPNDVVAVEPGGATIGKLAGSLAESIIRGGELQAVVVGFGLNVNWPSTLPDELDGVAVALNHLAGRDIDREGLLIDILEYFSRSIGELSSGPGGRRRVVAQIRSWSLTIGSRVRVELADGSFEGDAVDIDDDGELLVRIDGESEPRVVRVGDVVHLRPTS